MPPKRATAREYWAPLAAALGTLAAVMVMRPDFSRTYSRAVARFGGTLLGVFAATGVLQLTEPSVRVSALLAVACAALMYLLMRTGYAVSQFFVSAYVVLLLGMGGEEWTQTVPSASLLTLIGRPPRDGLVRRLPGLGDPGGLRTRLADWLAAAGRYAAEVVERYATPAGPDDTGSARRLREARAAHTAWQEALARARRTSRYAAGPVEDLGRRRGGGRSAAFSRAAMLMEAHLPERGAAPVPAAQRLAQALRTTTEQGARNSGTAGAPVGRGAGGARGPGTGKVCRTGWCAGARGCCWRRWSRSPRRSRSPAVRRVPRRAARRGRAAHLRYRVVTSPVGRPDGSSVGSEEGRSVGSSPGSTRAKVSSPAPSQETVRVLPSAPSSALPRARSVLPSAHFRASAWSWKGARAGRLADGGGLVAGDREEVRPAVDRGLPGAVGGTGRGALAAGAALVVVARVRAVAAALVLAGAGAGAVTVAAAAGEQEQGGRRGGGGDPERFPHVTFSPWWAV
ncbi:FUSC family protein [Streptomyces gougerotii]|uniref:FUSC family protein n=1 Tax=Streptomyces gougerotii TaxID=53448 RepID=UPI003530A4EB